MEQYWIITDSASSFSTSDFLISGQALGLGADAYCRKTTLSGGRQQGVELIEISNGKITLNICPTRGMGIVSGSCGEHYLGWNSPVKELVHPQYIDLYDLGGRGCHYGFNEMLNRCGIEWSGAMGEDEVIDNKGQSNTIFLPLHGKIGWTPASRVVLRCIDGTLILEGEVPEQNVFGVNYLLKTSLQLRPDATAVELEDTLCNLGAQPGEYEMLYHTNFGAPFLEKGSHYYGSYSRLVPRDKFGASASDKISKFSEPTPGFIEQVYLYRALADADGLAHQLLTNAAQDLGAHITFDPLTLPYTILWKRTAAEAEGYVAGMNPCTDLPNSRAFERSQKRVATIAPYSEIKFRHNISIVQGEEDVSKLAKKISALSTAAEYGEPGDFTFLTDN